MRSIGAVVAFSLCGAVTIAADIQPAQQNPPGASAAEAPTNAAPALVSSSPSATTAAPAPSASAAVQSSQTAHDDAAQAAPGREGTTSQQVAAQTASAPSTFEPPPGFRAVKRGSTTVYCKSIKPIGSNIPQTTCLDEQALQYVKRNTDVMRRDITQKTALCVGLACDSH
jgi:hypothetical protein